MRDHFVERRFRCRRLRRLRVDEPVGVVQIGHGLANGRVEVHARARFVLGRRGERGVFGRTVMLGFGLQGQPRLRLDRCSRRGKEMIVVLRVGSGKMTDGRFPVRFVRRMRGDHRLLVMLVRRLPR